MDQQQQFNASRAVSRGTDVSGMSFNTTMGMIDGQQYVSQQRMALARGLNQQAQAQQQQIQQQQQNRTDDYEQLAPSQLS